MCASAKCALIRLINHKWKWIQSCQDSLFGSFLFFVCSASAHRATFFINFSRMSLCQGKRSVWQLKRYDNRSEPLNFAQFDIKRIYFVRTKNKGNREETTTVKDILWVVMFRDERRRNAACTCLKLLACLRLPPKTREKIVQFIQHLMLQKGEKKIKI